MGKEKFYKQMWFMWLSLVVLAPVGIFLLWKYKRFNDKSRLVLTAVFAIFFVVVIIIGNSGSKPTEQVVSNEVATTQKPQNTPTVVPKVFDYTKAQITKDAVAEAIKGVIPADKLKGIDIEKKSGKYVIDVTFNPGDVWDEKDLVSQTAVTACDIMQILFTNAKVQKVWLWTQTEMTDAKGNASDEDVVNVSLSRANAKDINWTNFKHMVSADYNALFNIADSSFIAPGIASKLK
jgi:hypothetical protein